MKSTGLSYPPGTAGPFRNGRNGSSNVASGPGTKSFGAVLPWGRETSTSTKSTGRTFEDGFAIVRA
jgi:hypothetical protein